MGIVRHLLLAIFLFLAAIPLTAQSDGFIFHEVKAGETKYGIARQYEIAIAQLEKYNPEIKDGLKAGGNLLIPLQKAGDTAAATDQASPQDTSRFLYHPVKPKETLYSLSRDYGVSISQLKRLNSFLKNGLKVGQTLKIPRDAPPAPPEDKPLDTSLYRGHLVEKGETAFSLVQRYGWTLDSLYLLNPAAEEGLQIGQRLRIPRRLYGKHHAAAPISQDSLAPADQDEGPSASAPKEAKQKGKAPTFQDDYFLYKVKTGDTFYALKRKFNVEKPELVKLNPELKEGLFLDKYIIIPRKQKAPELSWLEKLFTKVEQAEKLEPLAPKTRKLKDSLNLPPNSMESVTEIDSDTLQVDTQKTYRVALLLPFLAHLPVDTITTEKPQFSGLSEMALDFYQGFRLAADTLARQGMNLQLQVYDTRKQAQRVKSLAERLRRQQVDLVVGPAYDRHVRTVAKLLEADDIPVVSPLSSTLKVAEHPNLVQAIPGKNQKNARLAAILNQRFPGTRVIFAHSGSVSDLQQVQTIKARLEARAGGNYLDRLVVSQEELAKTDRLQEALVEPGPEVVVLVGEDQVFINDLVSKLHAFRDSAVSILSAQSLLESQTLEYAYLESLNLTMAEVRYPRYQDTTTQLFLRHHRQRFHQEPSPFAFQGYDMGLHFLRKLWRNGPYFLNSLPGPAVQKTNLGFAFQKNQDGGYQNHYLHVTGLRDLQWVLLPAPGQKSASQKKEGDLKD
ncbi:MAG: LysM peptidoglycan-binding domain-containing protein [Schleiferiaceae bacterium]|nr:LysM peptidoglycan-binding domain-containing protein [Schleiferiaceae bacterium]